jgi:hypothetical protein
LRVGTALRSDQQTAYAEWLLQVGQRIYAIKALAHFEM